MTNREEEEEVGFLNPDRLKETAKKHESGELTCNIDDPEDCESCSGYGEPCMWSKVYHIREGYHICSRN